LAISNVIVIDVFFIELVTNLANNTIHNIRKKTKIKTNNSINNACK
jgi:hypothetical protein